MKNIHRFLFWNVKKNTNINMYIKNIVHEYDIDTIILAEYEGDGDELVSILSLKKSYKNVDSDGCKRIKIFSSYSNISPGYQNKYCSIQIFKKSYILCAMHLPSRLHNNEEHRNIISRDIIRELKDRENKEGIKNTIIVGDMNDNPYDYTCLAADTFHGIPSKYDASRGSRTINGSKYEMYYNPMWNLLGDEHFPPGTYYNVNSNVMCPYWYMYDQVLVSPQLQERFSMNDLKIVYKFGDYSLLDKNNHPNRDISDHLPIIFGIKSI